MTKLRPLDTDFLNDFLNTALFKTVPPNNIILADLFNNSIVTTLCSGQCNVVDEIKYSPNFNNDGHFCLKYCNNKFPHDIGVFLFFYLSSREGWQIVQRDELYYDNFEKYIQKSLS